MKELLNVGKVVNTHGIRGELKILPLTDFPEVRFSKNRELLLFPIKGESVSVVIESARLHKNMYIVRLKQYDDINKVEYFRGSMAKVPKDDVAQLEANEFYFHQIIGCTVVTDEGQELGVISEILTPGANDVWVVEPSINIDMRWDVGGLKPILIPFIEQVVLDINVEQKKIKVHLMEGLL